MVPAQPPQHRRVSARQAVIGACLLMPCAALLWVPLYAAGSPRVYGVPFFYWYMFVWVLITPVLMLIAYSWGNTQRRLRSESRCLDPAATTRRRPC